MPTDDKMDFADVVPIARLASGNASLSPIEAISWALAHKDQIVAVINFFKGIWTSFHHNTPPPTPPVIPPVVTPPNPPVPPAPPTSNVVTLAAINADNKGGIYFIEEWQNGEGTGHVVNKARFDEILGGSQVGRGASIHFNFSPIASDGTEIVTDDPRHALINKGLQYLEYQFTVAGQLSGWVQDGAIFGELELHQATYSNQKGCTPRVKVPGNLTNSRHRPFQFRVRDLVQTSIVSDWTPTIFVP